MATPLLLTAPAKLNLFLHVTGQRADGYHTLQTVFQLLDFGDQLTFHPRTDGQLLLQTNLAGVASTDNLVWRAARLLQQTSNCPLGCDITLHKHLPSGGGVGGGSSDAATTLLGLNALWQTGLHEAALADLGLQLGADVPLFVRGHSAWAEGIGEQLSPIPLRPRWYLVVHPGVSVATATIFRHKDLTRNTRPITLAAFREGAGRNDCEPVVCASYPEVNSALRWLSQYAPARLTGTGACIFASFTSADEANAILAKIPAKWRGFVAKGVDKSPVLQQLATWQQGP